ncbi:sensor histidine kinase [Nonomuraea rubra]|uniref:histidine kinase n=1 Tax=Nonomuraea rubra TaxID=46180 RepID=A0A7X0P7H6_9ACTN|nr:histidine kinase [Nonomuraea rubra]MBB6556722.1 signal transduction histidine kinase [Nonomuraea rubra]
MKQVVLGAGLAFAVGLVLIAGEAHLERGVPTWVLAVPLAFTCAGVLVRQRAPLACLGLGVVGIVIDGFVGPSLGTVLVFTDNLYAAALYGPARFSRVLLGVTGVLAVVAGAVAGFLAEDWRVLAVMGVQAGLVLITPVTTAVVLREQRDRAAAERARAEQVAHLAELDRQAAVAAERTRMARELHDMIANHFSAIAIQSTAALSRKDLDRETVRKVMESVRENSVKGMAEMRTMIGLLRQEGDEGENEATRPRLADAETLLERVRRAGMTVEMRVEGEARELPAAVDLAGYRILQEALTNALKHGDSPVSVAVVHEGERVCLSVENALGERGRRAELPGAGAGLIGMRERVSLVGGFFDAGEVWDGERGDGGVGRWRVLAVLPTAVDVTRSGISGEGEGGGGAGSRHGEGGAGRGAWFGVGDGGAARGAWSG